MAEDWIRELADESNYIEGLDAANETEIAALARVISLDQVIVHDLVEYVRIVQPNAALRSRKGMDVSVGAHIPIPGGPSVLASLFELLSRSTDLSAWDVYTRYEHLHPFMDGNGRSGRALWAWRHEHPHPIDTRFDHRDLGFLQTFHYETLYNLDTLLYGNWP